MYNKIKDLIDKSNKNIFDEISEHTVYKIKYIKEYVRRWLNVAVAQEKDVEFIDCMCNAGVYLKGQYTTSFEVFLLFNEYAKKHKNINFKLILNDNDLSRINFYKSLISLVDYESNVFIELNNKDVVIFLNTLKSNYQGYNPALTCLYVDPYNFGIPNLISTIKDFVSNVYCELIFNFFSSDITRNANNFSVPEKKEQIINEIRGFIPLYDPKEMKAYDVLLELQNSIKTTKNINFSFAYQFRNSKNIELYYIVYFTPNIRGIELLKETLWNVFEGDDNYYINERNKRHNVVDLFGETLIDNNISCHSEQAIKIITKKFSNKILTYTEIKECIIQNTLLKETQILKYVIKPMLDNNQIIRMNYTPKNNYKGDSYKLK